MNIDKPYTPEALCNRKMLVPIYQRLFVWDEDRIRKLLDDLFTASKNVDKPYYIGIITVHEKNGEWEIVDGQQRLTFLTLLGCALNRHKAVTKDESKTWNDFVFLSERGDGDRKNRISYVGRSGDEDVVQKWGDGVDGNNADGFDPSKLSGSFGTFYNVVEKFLNDYNISSPSDGGDPNELMNFGNYCFTKVEFLVNCLPEEYGPFDLNLYFEKMNSTGKQLEPIDVVKGKWFSESKYVGKFNMCMNFDKTYADQEKNCREVDPNATEISLDKIVSGKMGDGIDDDATDQSSLENRLPMKSEVLLLHALKLSLECWKQHRQESVKALDPVKVSFEAKSLIKTFSEVFDGFTTDDDRASFKRCFIDDLISYRKWIDDNIIYLKGAGQSYDYEIRDDSNNLKDDVPTQAQQFQAMLYVASSDAQEWVLDAYKECQLKKCALSLEVLKKCGVASKHDPSTIGTVELSYHIVDRYWFWRLDYELWSLVKNRNAADSIGVELKDEQKSSILHYKFRRNRSIEHLHPQSIEDDMEWGKRDNPKSAMHQFGNLAMMSVECNSAQSNDGIGTKFGRVKDWIASGRLESIKMLVMFALTKDGANKWTPDMSEGHCKKMMKILGCNLSVSNAEVQK